MPPKSDRPDNLTADQHRKDPAELTPPLCDRSPAVPPAIPADDPAPKPDYVLVADWIAGSRKDAVPRLTTLVFAVGWPLDRVESAVEAGVKAGLLISWPDAGAGPTVTLSEAEMVRRQIRFVSGRLAKSGHFYFRWVGIDDPDPQQKGGMRLKDKTRIALESQLGYGGRAKTRTTKVPRMERLAKTSGATDDYIMTAEYLGAHPRHITPRPGRTTQTVGEKVLQAKASSGAALTGSNVAWPDPAQYRYESPGGPPIDPGPAGPCPVCLGREPSIAQYCLRCDSAGVDGILPAAEPKPKDEPPTRGVDKKPRKRREYPGRKTNLEKS